MAKGPRPTSLALALALAPWLALPACNPDAPTPSAPPADAGPQPSARASSAPKIDRPAGFDLAGTRTEGGVERPVELQSAVVAKRPFGETLTVIASTHARTCKDLEGSYSLSPDETIFRIAVAPALEGDEWGVVDTYFDGKSMLGGTPSGVKVVGSDPSKPISITLPSLSLAGFKEQSKLVVHGTLVATGCGEVAEKVIGPGAPGPARPQEALELVVAGKRQRVVGAHYEEKDKRIVLSTSPLSCKSSYSYADVSLLLDADGKSANLQGMRVGGFSSFEPKPPPKIVLAPAANGERKTTFKGSFKKGTTSIELSGSAQLVVCE